MAWVGGCRKGRRVPINVTHSVQGSSGRGLGRAPVLSRAELPEILSRLRRHVRKQLHLDAPRRQTADGDVCAGREATSTFDIQGKRPG